jgi:hypothetical protein
MVNARRWACVLALILLLPSCDSPTEPPAEVEGVIAEVTSLPSEVLLYATADQCGARFFLDDRTDIRRRNANGRTSAGSISDLQLGRQASVWTDEPMTLGCPSEGRATQIEVVVVN